MATTAPSCYPVVVIGAGVAGLIAAKELSKDYSDVLVLEASSTTGGRVKEVQGLTAWDIPTGPEFVHGSNSILARVTEDDMKCKMRELAWPAHIYLGKEGKMLAGDHQDKELEQVDELFVEKLQSQKMPPPGKDITAEEWLRRQGATDKMLAYAEACYANDFGASLKQLGLREMVIENEKWDAGDTYLILDRSWRKMIEYLSEGLDIRTSWPVQKITYSQAGAMITASDGRLVAARRVILTASLKVLQKGLITFEPPLPEKKFAAISRLRMSNAVKIILVFKQKFWPEDIWDVVCTDCFVPEFWMTEYPATDGSPELRGLSSVTCFIAGAHAEQISASMTEEEMVHKALQQLDRIFAAPGLDKPATGALVRSFVADWSKEPYVQGAYTFPSFGAEKTDRQDLSAPVQGTLFFAGEATHPAINPCMQAAMETGQRAAAQVLAVDRPVPSRL